MSPILSPAIPVSPSSCASAVRPARPGDLDALGELFDLYRQFYAQPPGRAQARQFMADRMARQESVVLVAQDADGLLQGFCQLYPTFCSVEAQPICILSDLYVRAEARRGGWGRQLLTAAEAHARTTGLARLELTTAHTNHTAQALYAAMGWERDEVYRTYTRRVQAA